MRRRLSLEKRAESQTAAIELCTAILLQRRELEIAYKLSNALEAQIRKHISICLWHHSEAGGHKFLDVRWWSAEAFKVWRRDGVVSRKMSAENAHQHEHVHPQNQTIALLIAELEPSTAAVETMLSRLNEPCVVTSSEHRKLPVAGSSDEPWARYEGVIERIDTWGLPEAERPH